MLTSCSVWPKPRNLLQLLIAALFVSNIAAAQLKPIESKPNFVIVFADDVSSPRSEGLTCGNYNT